VGKFMGLNAQYGEKYCHSSRVASFSNGSSGGDTNFINTFKITSYADGKTGKEGWKNGAKKINEFSLLI
jgi:hypothetical protein